MAASAHGWTQALGALVNHLQALLLKDDAKAHVQLKDEVRRAQLPSLCACPSLLLPSASAAY